MKAGFKGQSYTINDLEKPEFNPDKKYDLIRLNARHGGGLSKSVIHYGLPRGGNSGYQAVNLAYQLGAKTILLLGFDMKGTHYFGNHPDGLVQDSPFHNFIESFKTITEVEIINCSPDSALTCFPYMRIQDAI